MADRDGRPEVERVADRAARADQVGGHDRLAVARREGVQRAEEQRQGQGDQHAARARAVSEQVGEAIAGPHRRCAVPGLQRHRARRAVAGRGLDRGRAHVERILQQPLRIRGQLARAVDGGHARARQRGARRGGRDDLAPADAIGVVSRRRTRTRCRGRRGRRSRRVRARQAQRRASRPGRAAASSRRSRPRLRLLAVRCDDQAGPAACAQAAAARRRWPPSLTRLRRRRSASIARRSRTPDLAHVDHVGRGAPAPSVATSPLIAG